MLTLSAKWGGLDLSKEAMELARTRVEAVVGRYALAVEREIQNNLSSLLKRRTGQLARDLRDFKVIPVKGGFAIEFSTDVPYAGIQEHGGTIKAKQGSYLTVPLPAAMSPSGVLKKRARFWKNTFVRKSKAGNLIIFQSRSKDIIPLFVLKKEVVIKATNWFSKAVTATQSEFESMLKEQQ